MNRKSKARFGVLGALRRNVSGAGARLARLLPARALARILLAGFLTLIGTSGAQAQVSPTWQGSGTNWSDGANWDATYGYGQLEWTGAGNTTSWNNLSDPQSQWRFYFSGSTAYTLGGSQVNFFDFGGANGGIRSDSSATQSINMNLSFQDSGSRPMFILTRSSGGLTFGGSVNTGGNVTALGIGGTNASSVTTFNGAITGTKPLVIGTNSFDGNATGMGTTRALFASSNNYTGDTTVNAGALTISHANALGATSAGTTVASGASLRMSNGITVSGEALSLNGTGLDSNGALVSVSGSNSYSGLITLAGTAYIGATNSSALTVSNVSGGANELWVVGAGTTTIAGGATNSGSGTAFVKTNTGAAVLMASNAWSGNEFIREGTVVLSNNNALGVGGTTTIGPSSGSANATLTLGSGVINSNAITVEAGGTGSRTLGYETGTGTGTQQGNVTLNNGLAFSAVSGGNLTVSGVISGGSGFTNVGPGTITFSGSSANTATGAGVISSGTTIFSKSANTAAIAGALTVNSGATLRTDAVNQLNNQFVIANGTMDFNNNSQQLALAGAGTVTLGNATLTNTNTGSETFSGLVSGTGALVKAGVGTLILSGSNSYSGTTTVNGGVLRAAHASALGATNSTATVNAGAALQLSNNIAVGNKALVLSSTGTNNDGGLRSISGDNSWGGNLTVDQGRIQTDAGSLTVGGNIGLGSSILYVSGAANTVLNGMITGASPTNGNGSLYYWGGNSSTLTLGGNNNATLSGLVSVRGGTLIVSDANSLGTGRLDLNSASSTVVSLQVNGTTTRTNEIKIGGGVTATNTTINVASGQNFTLNGNLSGDNTNNTTKFGKGGAGTLTLAFSNSTYNGQIQVGEGTVILTHANGLGTNESTSARGIDLGLNAGDVNTSTDAAILAAHGLTVRQSIYVATNNASAVRTVGLAGNGTNTFTNEIYLDGAMTVSAGTLATDRVNMTGQLIHTGSVTKVGVGTLVLSGNNTYSGGTAISNGFIQIAHNAALGTGTITNRADGGGLLTDGTARTIANAFAIGNSTLIGGTGALQIDGTTTVQLSAALTNNNAGGLTLSNLALGNSGTSRTLTLAGTGNTTINGVISNAAGQSTNNFVITSSGVTALNGANNYTGKTDIGASGFVVLGNNTALGSTAAGTEITAGGGTLDLNGHTVGSEALTLRSSGAGGNGALRNSSATAASVGGSVTMATDTTITTTNGNITLSGAVGESGGSRALTKAGNSTLTLSAASTYSGVTTISGGRLSLSGSGSISTNNLIFAGTTPGSLNLGGNSQTVASIASAFTSAGTVVITNGSLTVNGDANLVIGNALDGSAWDFSGLNSFVFNRTNREFIARPTTTTGSVTNTLNLAASGGGTNTISATRVVLGAAGGSSQGSGHLMIVNLGKTNTINTDTLEIGGFNGAGTVAFSSAVTNAAPLLTLRATDGTSRVGSAIVGWTSSGTRAGDGTFNLAGGAVDALVDTLTIGRHGAGANNTVAGTMTMQAGTLDATTLILGDKNVTTGTPTINATFNQSGGNVIASTMYLGNNQTNVAANFIANYNLTGGTLYAQTISGNGATYGGSTVRNLNVDGGTVRNLAGSDLAITGLADTASGRLNVVLGAGGGTFHADSGRGITLGANSLVSGSGALAKSGDGTLTLTEANTYSGGTTLSAGVLRVANASGLGTGTLTQSSGASTLQISNAGTVANNMNVYNVAFISGNNTLSGSLTLNNTTYDVASGTTNTLSGTLDGSGGITKTGAGELVIAGATNNTFTGNTDVQAGRLVLSKTAGVTAISSTNTTNGLRIATNAVVELAANNQINDAAGLNLDGGTFLTGTSATGYAETLGTLTLSSGSTIDFGSWAGGAGNRNINFADSSGISWGSGTLTITNWTQLTNSDSGEYGRLFFGSNTNSLTSGQLGQISFNIAGTLYGAKFLSDGEVVADITPIPEPRVYAAALALLAAVVWRERKRLLLLIQRLE